MSMIEATIEDNDIDDTIAKNFRQNLEDSLNDLNDVKHHGLLNPIKKIRCSHMHQVFTSLN